MGESSGFILFHPIKNWWGKCFLWTCEHKRNFLIRSDQKDFSPRSSSRALARFLPCQLVEMNKNLLALCNVGNLIFLSHMRCQLAVTTKEPLVSVRDLWVEDFHLWNWTLWLRSGTATTPSRRRQVVGDSFSFRSLIGFYFTDDTWLADKGHGAFLRLRSQLIGRLLFDAIIRTLQVNLVSVSWLTISDTG